MPLANNATLRTIGVEGELLIVDPAEAAWHASGLPHSPAATPRRRAAMCSATMIVGMLVLADGGSGRIEASTTERPGTP